MLANTIVGSVGEKRNKLLTKRGARRRRMLHVVAGEIDVEKREDGQQR